MSADATSTSFHKIVALARPKHRPLLMAIGILLASLSVSLSIPFTVGKFIDYFTSANPTIPYGFSLTQANGGLPVFTVGGTCDAGRPFLMASELSLACANKITLRHFGEKSNLWSAGSRLSVDSSVVGERTFRMDSIQRWCRNWLYAYLIWIYWGYMLISIQKKSLLELLVQARLFPRRPWRHDKVSIFLKQSTAEALMSAIWAAQEALAVLPTVQVFNAIPHEEKRFSDRVDHMLTHAHRDAVACGVFFGSTGWSKNGGSLVSRGQISVGELTRLLIYTVYVGSGLQMITPLSHAPFFTSVMRGVGSGTRIFELLDRTSSIQPGVGVALDPKRTGPLRSTFSYPSRSMVNMLEGFDFEVKVGENMALVYVFSETSEAGNTQSCSGWDSGRRGGGKSSMRSSLLRYYDPVRSKSCSTDACIGVDTHSLDPVLFAGTIASNIAYGNENKLKLLPVRPTANSFGDYQTVSTRGTESSGCQGPGASERNPVILALDEATISLYAPQDERILVPEGDFFAHPALERFSFPRLPPDGHITETGTYCELVRRKTSCFRTLMAAQLSAPSEELIPVIPAPGAFTCAAGEEHVPIILAPSAVRAARRGYKHGDEVLSREETSLRSEDAGGRPVS
ncbi:hypothetical protein EI94DRAFT_1874774 [Lactarius quietus]|nr:hypothetical protein EI94DRAFT_1874774 [Lactarius quietus]